MWSILDEHRRYVDDAHRVRAFEHAIARAVRPGDVVLDLGAGTGILGILACRAGASRVYAVESTSAIELTRDIVRANRCDDRVTLIKGISTSIDLPERVHVIVCDQVSGFGFEAGIAEYLRDARARFLVPRGRMLPEALRLAVAPVESQEQYQAIDFWTGSATGLDLSPVGPVATNTPRPARFLAEHIIGDTVWSDDVDPSRAPSVVRVGGSSPIERSAMLHGLAGWFSAKLYDEITMGNSPFLSDAIDRQHVLFPIEQPTPVEAGDQIELTVCVRPTDQVIVWTVELRHDGAPPRRFRQSTLHGFLLSRTDLVRADPNFRPGLEREGRMRRTVLTLCDGQHTVAEIERELLTGYPDAFSSTDSVATFVARVLARNAP